MKKQFALAPIFKDNMIFQANKPIRIYGECKKGIEIVVSFLNQEIKYRSKSTDFLIELKPVSYQDKGFSFTVFTKKQELTIYNCLIGDVFLVAGGMNAYMPLKESYHEADCDDNTLRFLDFNSSIVEKQFNGELNWKISSRDSLDEFSALGYLIAKQVHQVVKKPLGIISCSNPETTIFSWLSEREINSHLEIYNFIEEIKDSSLVEQYNPSVFFEQMIKHLLPFGIGCVIMYQGESDHIHSHLYSVAVSRLIHSYKMYFRDNELPFIFTQIAGYSYKETCCDNVTEVRSIQANLMSEDKNVYIVSAIDLGDEETQYLKEKHIISKRISNVILDKLHKVVKNSIAPSYYSYNHQNDKLIIYTQNNYLNLVSHSTKNLGFTYTVDGINYSEIKDVRLVSNQIVISDIEGATEIRYAYSNYPVCDIYTTNELPLLPFKINHL